MRAQPRVEPFGARSHRILAAWVLIVPAALIGSSAPARGWGRAGHELAAAQLSALLPDDGAPLAALGPMVLQHVMDAERRMRDGATPEEPPRHFFRLDAYPWADRARIPARREEWDKRFGADRVRARGTLPWAVDGSYRALVAAFRARDAELAGRRWADLCHYVADAHQPLRASMSAEVQAGVEGGLLERFEVTLLERYRHHLELDPSGRTSGRAVSGAFEEACHTLRESLAEAPKIMSADRAAAREGVGSPAYYARMWHELSPLIESQLGAAAVVGARLGYAAWVEAGRPALSP